MMKLPVEEILEDLNAKLKFHSVVILEAPPGAGKTTLVPLSLLKNLPSDKKIYVLEPRRIAVKNSAIRMSALLGEGVGNTVGYMVRYESKLSKHTRIVVMTEGVLLQLLLENPELSGVDIIVLDEFHERSINVDLSLALLREVQRIFHPELKILMMSATINSELLSKTLENCPVLKSEGKIFPLEIKYCPIETRTLPEKISKCIYNNGLRDSILVFLPGKSEILKTKKHLEEFFLDRFKIVPLHGELSLEEQALALFPDKRGQPKIILSTNIAESSLTIEGIHIVIDTGLARELRFHSGSSLTRLETIEIAMDSADQRAGRAARTKPGQCFRLWDSGLAGYREKVSKPEILRSELSSLVLTCLMFGTKVEDMNWVTVPPLERIQNGIDTLFLLGLIDKEKRVTAKGQIVGKYPVNPRIGNLVYMSNQIGQGKLGIQIAAILSERDFLRKDLDFGTSLEFRVEMLSNDRIPIQADGASFSRVKRIYKDLIDRIPLTQSKNIDLSKIGLLLSFAYPDRVAKSREINSYRYKTSSGQGVILPKNDPNIGSEYIVIAETDGSAGDALVYLSARIDKNDLNQFWESHFRFQFSLDPSSDKLQIYRDTYFGELLISRVNQSLSLEKRIEALIASIRENGKMLLNWTPDVVNLIDRTVFLSEFGGSLPFKTEEDLLKKILIWIEPYLQNINRLTQLKSISLMDCIYSQFSYQEKQILEREAPAYFVVPSGSKIRIVYDGNTPLVRVKLQEVFGLLETPILGFGKVALVFELLSPAMRPVQKTSDLQSFWKNAYPEIKKELKGRYPKHPWPEDPYKAIATRYTKKVSK
jgi:ATP-dependent helicase HrpB